MNPIPSLAKKRATVELPSFLTLPKVLEGRAEAAGDSDLRANLRDDLKLFYMLLPWGIAGVLLIALSFIASHELEHLDLETSGTMRWCLELAKSLLLEVGIAFIVSCFVAGTIERIMRIRTKKETEKELQSVEKKKQESVATIQDNVFRHLFGFRIDDAILEELYQTIFATKLMRKNLVINYVFDLFPGKPDLLVVGNTVEYELHNTSTEAISWPVNHYFENVIKVDSFADAFTEFRVEESTTGNVLIDWNASKCRSCMSVDGIRQKLKVDNQAVHPGRPLKIKFRYQAVRRLSDMEIWVTTLPTEGFIIQAIVDGKLPDFDILTDSAHRNELRVDNQPDGDSQGQLRVFRWSFTSGILPYQGVILYWFPKSLFVAASKIDSAHVDASGDGPSPAKVRGEVKRRLS